VQPGEPPRDEPGDRAGGPYPQGEPGELPGAPDPAPEAGDGGSPGPGGGAGGATLSRRERAELERLRASASASPGHKVAATARWFAACVVLLVAALLAGVAVIATYVRNQVLDTNTYVQTVTPLVQDPVVRDAVAHRLSQEIVTATNLQGLATSLADNLVARGAPARIDDLVAPLVSGVTNLLYERIGPLLATPQFEQIWQNLNRVAHQGVVTALTGSQGKVVKTGTDTISIDLGALLTAAKTQLVNQGFGFASKIPDVSIPYTLVQSDKLPKIRTYTKVLNTVGSWLPYVALALLVAGILIAPNRRRGLIVGAAMVAGIGLILLAGLAIFRSYYRDHLPPTVVQQAAVDAYDIVLRYLRDAMRTLVAVSLVLLLIALLAGPSRLATWVRRMINLGLGYVAGWLARAGSWTVAIGRSLAPAVGWIKVGVVLVSLVLYLALVRPTVSSALWWVFGILVFLAIVEIFARVPGDGARARAAPA
jgi:hypothetical protein